MTSPAAIRFPSEWAAKILIPAKRGIVGLTKHQAIWGLAMWSVVHILINGDVASFCMFGLLTLLGFGGPKSLDAKCKKNLGEEARTRPFEKVSETSAMAALRQMGPWRAVFGLAVYAGFLFLHQPIIGVSPLPAF